MNERFTEKAEAVLNRSIEIAEELGHTYIGTEHLMLSLLEDNLSSSGYILGKFKVKSETFRKAICDYSGIGMKSTLSSKDMTPRCRRILENSYTVATKHGYTLISTEHILHSLLEERDCIATKLLKNLGVDINSVREETINLIRARSAEPTAQTKPADIPTLRQYGKNFTEMARRDRFDPVIGRETETDRIIRILCRKNKNNPCLIGEAGVGKSAIVEGLAIRIANGDVPPYLQNKSIISVDLTSMVAGAKYRGDFEERIKNIISEATKNRSVILFIDEIHTIVGAGAAEGAIDASNILKPQLSRGELQIIGATTFSEYRKYIEKDPALERRFQPIAVEEPDFEKTLDMLRGVKSRYESHHGVSVSDDVLRECIALSIKYTTDRFLPDKAIDLLDETCALVATKAQNGCGKIKELNDIMRQILAEKEIAIQNQDFSLALEIKKKEEEHRRILEVELSADSNDQGVKRVTVEDVKRIVSEISGIDINSVRSSIDYDDLKFRLQKRVIGQDLAIEKLVMAVKRSEVGLGDPVKPRGTFLFIGESGVGKTALASALAEEIFNNRNALLRFDMSEYSEKHAVSKLIGAPPGYSGHDEGGALTEAVRKKPYSVILFDEIEKADREVQNLFLQIADYGYLSDSSGKRVSFRNTYVIMTSNVTSSASGPKGKMGFVEDASEANSELLERLRKNFSDEFINRFDEIIPFSSLTRASLVKIVERNLLLLDKNLASRGLALKYSPNLPEYVVDNAKTRHLGARPIIRYINTEIRDAISEHLILNRTPSGSIIFVGINDESIIIKSEINEEPKKPVCHE